MWIRGGGNPTVDATDYQRPARIEALVVLALAVGSAVAVKVPDLFGLELDGGDRPFYTPNGSLFVLPFLAGYFAWKRRLAVRV